MSKLPTKSVAPEQKIETRTAVITIAARAVAILAVLVATAVYAQDKYLLKSPSGIAFSDFRGYEDWAVVSSARTDEVLKVIVANPAMVKAYKAGVPGDGQPFPDGSMIVKLQWKPKKSTEAPFVVEVPDVFSQAFVMEKDSKRFAKSGGLGIRGVQLRSRIGQLHGRSQKPLRLRVHVPYASEGEGLHLPPVRETLNRTCPHFRSLWQTTAKRKTPPPVRSGAGARTSEGGEYFDGR